MSQLVPLYDDEEVCVSARFHQWPSHLKARTRAEMKRSADRFCILLPRQSSHHGSKNRNTCQVLYVLMDLNPTEDTVGLEPSDIN